MNNGKIGILMIVLGNILYLAYAFFCGSETTPFDEFSSGYTAFDQTKSSN